MIEDLFGLNLGVEVVGIVRHGLRSEKGFGWFFVLIIADLRSESMEKIEDFRLTSAGHAQLSLSLSPHSSTSVE